MTTDLSASRTSNDLVQRGCQLRNCAINILQFVETEQTDAERPEISTLIALQRDTCSNLQSLRKKLGAVLQLGITGVTDDNARRLEALGRNTGKAFAFH